jgi:nucleotidyltransferase/DNA polymerase involved in DNA repair
MRDLRIRKVGLASFAVDFTHQDLQIPFIGRVSERILEELGIKTCGDVYTHRAMILAMDKQLGLEGLLKAYLGIASNVVEPPARENRKSIGVERYVEQSWFNGKLFS